MSRGQANLTALVVAILAVSAALTAGLVLADNAFGSAERDATERQLAIGVSESIIDPRGSVATRQNVLNETAITELDEATFRSSDPAFAEHDVAVRLDGEELFSTDDDVQGPSIRRLVLVEERQSVTRTPPIREGDEGSVTVPRRTERVRVSLDPPESTTVNTLRVSGRVERHNDSGLAGEHTIDVSPYETVTLDFETEGPLTTGDVAVQYFPTRSKTALLEVEVDA